MAKVLFVNGPASGHVYPTLGIVKELIEAGEEVVYVSSEDYREKLERLGAQFVAYGNFLAGEDPFSTKHFMSLVNKILASYDVILPCIAQLTQQYKFDYFLHDSMYGCGKVLSDMLNIPSIATCTSFIHAERLTAGNTGRPEEWQENLLLLRKFVSLTKKLSAKYNINRKLGIDNVFFNEGDLNLVFTSAYFQPSYKQLDNRYKFVGPSITDRGERSDFPLDCIEGQKTIYISLGTVFNQVQEFYQQCNEAFSSFEGKVILSAGNKAEMDWFHNIPGHFIVRRYVPQLEVLRHADLFITHGGMNSVNEALYFGVPLIVVPMGADQPIVAERVSGLGAGKRLNREQLSPQLLRETAEHILNTENYRLNSAKIGTSLKNAGGPKKAIEEIRLFKQSFGLTS